MKTRSSFNIFHFLLVYALLAGWFYCFVGVVSLGGKVYSPFLDNYLNVPAWLTWLISKCSLVILKMARFDAFQRAPNNVTIKGSSGVTIIWACLGFGVMSFWTAFVTAHKATWKYKLKWCVGGIGIITALNIVRIVLIAVANYYHWEVITNMEPHQAFNIASYTVLFGLIGWFVWRYRQYEKFKVVSVASSHKVISPVVTNQY